MCDDKRYRMKAYIGNDPMEGTTLMTSATTYDEALRLLEAMETHQVISGGHIEVWVKGPGWVLTE